MSHSGSLPQVLFLLSGVLWAAYAQQVSIGRNSTPDGLQSFVVNGSNGIEEQESSMDMMLPADGRLRNSTPNQFLEPSFAEVDMSSTSEDDNAPAHAGCFIVQGGQMLSVKLTYDGLKYDIPGGQSTWHESARETAVRETWEESGYRVRAGHLLARVRNDFHIFQCYLLHSEPEKGPDHEISEVNWFTMTKVQQLADSHEWRFQPAQAPLYTNWLHSSFINGANSLEEPSGPIDVSLPAVGMSRNSSLDQFPQQSFAVVNMSSTSEDDNAPAHAGCFILQGGQMLTVKLTYDGLKYDIPGGQSTWHESARETAVRETWEESGYRVRAGSLLARVRNDFHIFHCYLLHSEPEKGPDHEISEVNWFTMTKVQQLADSHEWRFQPAQAPLYTNWLRSSLINSATSLEEPSDPIDVSLPAVGMSRNSSLDQFPQQSFAAVDIPSTSEDDTAPAHAGCFIVQGGQMLTVKLTYDGLKYDIPGGQSTWSESARETAVRETWEESGYRVRAGHLLARVRNDFHIFHCYLLHSEPEKGHDHEISEVTWFTMTKVQELADSHEWRFQPAQAHLYTNWLHSSLVNGVNGMDDQLGSIDVSLPTLALARNSTADELLEESLAVVNSSSTYQDHNATGHAGSDDHVALEEPSLTASATLHSNDDILNSDLGPRQLTVIV